MKFRVYFLVFFVLSYVDVFCSQEIPFIPYNHTFKYSPIKETYTKGDTITVTFKVTPFPEEIVQRRKENNRSIQYFNTYIHDDYFVRNKYITGSEILKPISWSKSYPFAKILHSSLNDSLVSLNDNKGNLEITFSFVLIENDDNFPITFPILYKDPQPNTPGGRNKFMYKGEIIDFFHKKTLLAIPPKPYYMRKKTGIIYPAPKFIKDIDGARIGVTDMVSGRIGFTFYSIYNESQTYTLDILYEDENYTHNINHTDFYCFEIVRESRTDYLPTATEGDCRITYLIKSGSDVIGSGELDLNLNENRFWNVGFYINNHMPYDNFQNRLGRNTYSLPERFQTANGDSLFIIWGGGNIYSK